MRKRMIFKVLFVALFLTGCNENGEFKSFWSSKVDKEYEELHTMVYIDISLSRDSTSILNALGKMEKVFLSQPRNIASRFIVKVIDSDNSVAALFDNFSEALTDKRYDSVEEFKEGRKEDANKMRNNILSYYKNVAPYKESSTQSCICNSLENTQSYFKQLDTTKCKIQLIVFSDMYEECRKKSSYFNEDFCMCNGEHKKRKSLKQLLEMVESFSPKSSLKRYVKAKNLYFILDENDRYNESGDFCLKSQEVETLWEEILIKMGYSRHEWQDITFDQMVPGRLIQTEE